MTYHLLRGLPAIGFLLAATGCAMTHEACEGGTCDSLDSGLEDSGLEDSGLDSGGCPGIAPTCYRGWLGSSDCCLEGSTMPAICVGGTWACAPRHYTRAECGRVDPVCEGPDAGSGPGTYDDCAMNSECTLVPNTCCGVCGEPSAEDLAATQVDRMEAYYADVSCPESREGPVPCPECASVSNPELIATCDMTGFRPACALVDLGVPPYAQCAVDSDCVLAAPECCACGEIPLFSTISVNTTTDLQSLLCDFTEPCPPCVPVFNPRARATCVGGLCRASVDP